MYRIYYTIFFLFKNPASSFHFFSHFEKTNTQLQISELPTKALLCHFGPRSNPANPAIHAIEVMNTRKRIGEVVTWVHGYMVTEIRYILWVASCFSILNALVIPKRFGSRIGPQLDNSLSLTSKAALGSNAAHSHDSSTSS